MVKHDPAGLPLAKNFMMTQDLKVVGFDEGVWKSSTGFYSLKAHTQYVADVQAGQVGYMGILNDGDNGPAFFSLRLKVDNGLIHEAEMLVTHRGEGSPFVPHGYLYREAPYIRDVPVARRSTRKELLAATDHFWKVSTTTHNHSRHADGLLKFPDPPTRHRSCRSCVGTAPARHSSALMLRNREAMSAQR